MAKKPTAVVAPPGLKRPTRAVPDPDVIKHEPLGWGFRFLDLGGQWGWRNLNPLHLDELHRELCSCEGVTLHKLLGDRRIKEIPVAHMRDEAKQRLQERRLEEADTLWELRLPNKWRAWGLVEGSTFFLLWWDENETACGHPPKGVRRKR